MKLNAAQQAALDAGQPLIEVLAMATPGDDDGTGQEQQANSGQNAEDDLTLEQAQARIAELEGESTTQAQALALAQEAQATAEATAQSAVADKDAAVAQVAAVAGELSQYVSQMAVSMGMTVDVKALSTEQLVAKHSELRAEFTKKFTPGRKAKTAVPEAKAAAIAENADIIKAAKNFVL